MYIYMYMYMYMYIYICIYIYPAHMTTLGTQSLSPGCALDAPVMDIVTVSELEYSFSFSQALSVRLSRAPPQKGLRSSAAASEACADPRAR